MSNLFFAWRIDHELYARQAIRAAVEAYPEPELAGED